MRKRQQAPYLVEGDLAQWEKKNDPLAELGRLSEEILRESFVPLEHQVSQLTVSTDQRHLYLLSGKNGVVQDFDIAKKQVVQTYSAPGPLASMALVGEHIVVAEPKNGTLYRLDRRSFKEARRLAIGAPVRKLLPLSSPRGSMVVVLGEGAEHGINTGKLLFVDGSHWLGGTAKPFILSRIGRALDVDANSRWLGLLKTKARSSALHVTLVPLPSGLSEYIRYETLAAQPNARQMSEQLSAMYERVQSRWRRFEVRFNLLREQAVVPTLLLASSNRFICARRSYNIGAKPPIEGLFDTSTYLKNADLTPAQRLAMSLLQSIFTVSKDGRYAVSGLCVFDVASRKMIKRLPLAAVTSAFSTDGKALYLGSHMRSGVCILSDWQSQLTE